MTLENYLKDAINFAKESKTGQTYLLVDFIQRMGTDGKKPVIIA